MLNILIAGLLPVHNQELLRGFGSRGNLRFITTDASAAQWGRTVNSTKFDKVIVATRFVSHKHYDHVPRAKLVYANGGMSSVRRLLDEMLPTVVNAEPAKATTKPAQTTSPPELPMTVPTETPATEPRTKPTVFAVVAAAVAIRTPGVPFTVEECAKAIGEPKPAVNAALVTLRKKGYLDAVGRGKYAANVLSEEAAKLGQGRARPKAYTKGKLPKSASLADLLAEGKILADALIDLLGQIANVKPEKPSVDLSVVPERALWDELSRRRKA